jgi:hypothetical protein
VSFLMSRPPCGAKRHFLDSLKKQTNSRPLYCA